MKKLEECNSYFLSEKENENGETYLCPFYMSGCRKFAKKQTSRKLRKSNDFKLNGCAYRRKFDYWYTLFWFKIGRKVEKNASVHDYNW